MHVQTIGFSVLTAIILSAFCFVFVSCDDGAQKKIAYYISPGGDDTNSGLSPSESWRSIDKVNTLHLEPGEKVLFEGGQTFDGTLLFDEEDGGDPDNPVIIGSYGEGRSTIHGGMSHGIFLTETNGWIVQDINVIGNGRNANDKGVGIYIDSARNVSINSVEALGFQIAGILVTRGSENVRITNSNAYDNGYAGITTGYYYGRRNVNKNIYVGYCRTFNNPGISDSTANFRDQSGSGIHFARVEGGLIEYCEAYNNGYDFFHRGGNGPVGIWASSTSNLTIQYCISHDNKSYHISRDHKYADGGGFDFDSGVKNSIIQYCYSYNNSAAGFLICAYSAEERHLIENCIIRYSISENDGHMGHKANLHIHNGSVIKNIQVYNNLFLNSGGRSNVSKGGTDPTNEFHFYNNIFLLRDKGEFVSIESLSEGSFDLTQMPVFQGNLYWNYTHPGNWDGYESLAQWQKVRGQEIIDGKTIGLNEDPLFRAFGYWKQLTDPTKLNGLTYIISSESPCIDAGIDLKESFGIDQGSSDFFGNKLHIGSIPDMGPFEHTKKTIVGN